MSGDKHLPLLVVQPWLEAPGHPELSLLHTARGLHGCCDLGFLVPAGALDARPGLKSELACLGNVFEYRTRLSGFPNSTRAALARVRQLARNGSSFGTVWFLDAHLPTLSLLMAAGVAGGKQAYAVMLLQGPERALRSAIRRALFSKAAAKTNSRYYCRTDELTAAWRAAVPELGDRLATLPSLEISHVRRSEPAQDATLKIGILGQIRSGKGIERAFRELYSQPGVSLSVAGPFASTKARRRYAGLLKAHNQKAGWLTESELEDTAAQLDYVLLLYDDWDDRMESGIFYLAASVGRPVVVYAGGWCARQVAEYGCGIVVERDPAHLAHAHWPRPGSESYSELAGGMRRFADDHRGPGAARKLLHALGVPSAASPGSVA